MPLSPATSKSSNGFSLIDVDPSLMSNANDYMTAKTDTDNNGRSVGTMAKLHSNLDWEKVMREVCEDS